MDNVASVMNTVPPADKVQQVVSIGAQRLVRRVVAAEEDGADYVSVGRLYDTASKSDTRPATTDTIRAVKTAVSVPVCAIGGINESNIDAVIAAGADMVAVISAVCAATDPRDATKGLAGRF